METGSWDLAGRRIFGLVRFLDYQSINWGVRCRRVGGKTFSLLSFIFFVCVSKMITSDQNHARGETALNVLRQTSYCHFRIISLQFNTFVSHRFPLLLCERTFNLLFLFVSSFVSSSAVPLLQSSIHHLDLLPFRGLHSHLSV